MRGALLAICLAALAVSAGAQSRQPPDRIGTASAQSAQQDQDGAEPAARDDYQPADAANQKAAEERDSRERQKTLEERNFWLSVFVFAAAALQAVLTGIGIYFTGKQFRAYMTFDSIDVSIIEVGKPINYEIVFRNTGPTPAKNVTGAHQLGLTLPSGVLWPDMKRLVPKVGPRRDVGAGGITTFAGSTGVEFDWFDELAFDYGKATLYIHGRIEYRDVLGFRHWVNYRMRGTPDGDTKIRWWPAEEGNESS